MRYFCAQVRVPTTAAPAPARLLDMLALSSFRFPLHVASGFWLLTASGLWGCSSDISDPPPSFRDASVAGYDAAVAPSPGDAAAVPNLHADPDELDGGARLCAIMRNACHDLDKGSGDLADKCHDWGHEGDPEVCTEHYSECMAFCSHADAGATPDAAAQTDAAQSPPHDAALDAAATDAATLETPDAAARDAAAPDAATRDAALEASDAASAADASDGSL